MILYIYILTNSVSFIFMTYMYNMVKYNYTQGIFFVFVTAINLVFLYHTMLFRENIIDAYLFTIVSQENKTNCAHRNF